MKTAADQFVRTLSAACVKVIDLVKANLWR